MIYQIYGSVVYGSVISKEYVRESSGRNKEFVCLVGFFCLFVLVWFFCHHVSEI